MILLLTLAFPGVLLALLLAMEKVELPLRDEAVGDDVVHVLEQERADEVERFVRDGLAPAVDRYWRRSSWRRRLSTRRLPARG